jgi:hypothetical protein
MESMTAIQIEDNLEQLNEMRDNIFNSITEARTNLEQYLDWYRNNVDMFISSSSLFEYNAEYRALFVSVDIRQRLLMGIQADIDALYDHLDEIS